MLALQIVSRSYPSPSDLTEQGKKVSFATISDDADNSMFPGHRIDPPIPFSKYVTILYAIVARVAREGESGGFTLSLSPSTLFKIRFIFPT